jgi:hypothetical protein
MHHYRLPAVAASYPPAEVVFDGDEDVEAEVGEMIPYAHRDIKPA